MATANSTSTTVSAFVAGMDNHTSSSYGENGHLQHSWSNKLQERIVQLSFQLVRTTPEGVNRLSGIFNTILYEIKGISNKDERSKYMDITRRLLLNTRDLEDGKGEWSLGYALLRVYFDHYPEEALKMIKYFVTELPKDQLDGKAEHPYGSWKDIKKLWVVFGGVNAPEIFTNYLVKLSNVQLRQDSESNTPSLAARWLPRAKGAAKSATPYRPLFEALAKDYYSNYMATARTPDSKIRAQRKAYTDYRKLLSKINRVLDTTQIKQCSGKYAEIDYSKVTSVTMRNQTRAFQNKKGKCGDDQRSMSDDRIIGAANFSEFVAKALTGKVSGPKGKRVGINKMVQDMRELTCIAHRNTETIAVKDLQWEDAGTKIGNLGNFIAMSDLSGSMIGDPIHAAIGLGLRIAERSRLGRRIMTFSGEPKWINLDGSTKLSEMISTMTPYERSGMWGMNTDFNKALNMILNVCVEKKLSAREVEDMVLVIFSDMQIDVADSSAYNESMWQMIERMYASAGRRAVGVPYKPPHILFWNLRHTSGFPVLSEQKNCTMFSGFSPALLNSFMESGMEAIKNCSPWNMLNKQLESPRYNLTAFP